MIENVHFDIGMSDLPIFFLGILKCQHTITHWCNMMDSGLCCLRMNWRTFQQPTTHLHTVEACTYCWSNLVDVQGPSSYYMRSFILVMSPVAPPVVCDKAEYGSGFIIHFMYVMHLGIVCPLSSLLRIIFIVIVGLCFCQIKKILITLSVIAKSPNEKVIHL